MSVLVAVGVAVAAPRHAAATDPDGLSSSLEEAWISAPPSASAPWLASAMSPHEPEPRDDLVRDPPNAYARTETLLIVDMVLATAHMTDNVISRRTFSSPYLPVTATQALYLVLPASYFLDLGPLFNVIASSSFLFAHANGHFAPWASSPVGGFHDIWASGDNRVGVASGPMGRVSQGALIGLDAAIAATLASAVVDGVRHGFTWRKRPATATSSSVAVVGGPTADGGARLMLSLSW